MPRRARPYTPTFQDLDYYETFGAVAADPPFNTLGASEVWIPMEKTGEREAIVSMRVSYAPTAYGTVLNVPELLLCPAFEERDPYTGAEWDPPLRIHALGQGLFLDDGILTLDFNAQWGLPEGQTPDARTLSLQFLELKQKMETRIQLLERAVRTAWGLDDDVELEPLLVRILKGPHGS